MLPFSLQREEGDFCPQGKIVVIQRQQECLYQETIIVSFVFSKDGKHILFDNFLMYFKTLVLPLLHYGFLIDPRLLVQRREQRALP